MAFDTIVQGGTVIDGTGQPGYDADVGVSDGRIRAIGALADAETARRIDASGHVVAPGFIDMHSHSDRAVLDDPLGESMVHQGVTTEVVGNCGFTPFPIGPVGHEPLVRAHTSKVVWDWTDFDGWARRVEDSGASYNTAGQVGHHAIRTAVGLVDNRPPTDDELKSMRRLTAEAVEQGCFSFSTGLTLAPSLYADTDEIVALCEAIALFDGAFYVSHARVWGGNHVGAVEECVEIGQRAGVPVQYSHMAIIDSRAFGDGPQLTGVLEKANEEGVDATYDMYPYTAAGTHLQQLVPEWLQVGGQQAMLARLRDPETRKKAREDTAKGWFRGLPWDWDSVVLAYLKTDANLGLIGKSIAEAAVVRGEEPLDTMLSLIDEEDNYVGIVMHNRVEGDVRYFLGHPLAMIGSDGIAISPTGIYGGEKHHPRYYGTYPRVLGRYVREKPSVVSLEEAIWKMTGFPARRLTLSDRGVIAEGKVADLVVFNPDTVIDNATFEEPHQYPDGIPYVMVNGTTVVDDGVHTGARPGVVLRRGVN